jgi:sugar/nucleoside kinase (ribokinase family)
MKFDVIAIGGITEDIMFHTDEMRVLKNKDKYGSRALLAFEAGDKIISDKNVLYTCGGGGANSAVSLAKLGLKVALIASLGEDRTAVKLLHDFKKNKVNTKNIQLYKNSWTGLSLIVSGGAKNEHVIFTHRAANEKLKLTDKHLSAQPAEWFYLTSLKGPEAQNNLEVIFKVAVKNKVKIAWNPGSTQLDYSFDYLKKYLARTRLLILNREEAMELIKKVGKQTTSVKEMFKIISYFGPEIISISDGARGAYIFSDDFYKFEKSLKYKAVNTTGAGDAFGSSLVGGLIIFNGDLKQALKLAIIRSNEVVRVVGAQEGLLTLNQVKEKYGLGTGRDK